MTAASSTTAALEHGSRAVCDPGESRDLPIAVRRVGWALLGLQLVAMFAFSTVEYHRYALSVGFGTYTQAWVAIAHGHLDPYSTLIHKPFWRNDAELVLWPLAPLFYVYPHPIDLLWVQDVAVVLTEAVAFGWVLEVLQGSEAPRRERLGPAIALGSVLVMVANPFCYQTIAYDFHSEVLSALFVVLAGRALWSGRTRRLWWWVPLALATNALAGLYVLGVGMSGVVAGSRTRRAGLLLVGAGLAWLVVVSLVGGNQYGYTNSLGGWYGYLVGPHHGTVTSFDVALGALSHPAAALRMMASRWALILDFLLAVGLIGIASPWAWPVALVVIVPSALNANAAFLDPHASFQTWPALPFVLVGSVMVLVRLLRGSDRARRAASLAAGAWAASLAVLAAVLLPNVWSFWLAVSPAAAAQLARADARIPADAEVVASWGVVGRFAVRGDVHPYDQFRRTFQVERRQVVFVLTPGEGVFEASAAETRRAVARVEHLPGATTLVAADHVYAVAWRPPAGTTRVTLP